MAQKIFESLGLNNFEVGRPLKVRSVKLAQSSDGVTIFRTSDLAVLYFEEEVIDESELCPPRTSFPLGCTCCVIPSSSGSTAVEDWISRRLLSSSRLDLRRVPRRSVSAESS